MTTSTPATSQVPPSAREHTIRSELELLARLRVDEPDAFQELVELHGPRMLTTARRLLGSGDEAEDALQEAFLNAFRGLARFDGRSRLGTWLHRIVVNVALMRLRARKPPPESIEALLPDFTGRGSFQQPPSAWIELPEDPLEREELCGAVRAAIELLPEPYRTALILHDIEELSNQELAQRLGVTVNAAKIRVHRARQGLKTLLDPRLAE